MLFTLVAGLKYPQLAAGIGAVWTLLRTLFMYGYVYSGKPQGKGRLYGGMFWLAQGALWGLTVFGVARDLISSTSDCFSSAAMVIVFHRWWDCSCVLANFLISSPVNS